MPPEDERDHLALNAQATMTATASTRSNFSIPYILAAASFSRRVGALENTHSGEAFGPFWESIHAEATACVLLAVAALESYANELFLTPQEFPAWPREVMAKLWELAEPRPALEKYQFALLLRRAQEFDPACGPYQDAALLVKLRNALTHFKPEWFDEQVEHAKLSRQLTSKIQGSPFLPTEPLFPRAWAGHSGTAWAVGVVTQFVVEFESRTGVTGRMQRFVARLNP